MAHNIDIKDAAGANVTVKTTEGAGPDHINVPHHIVDSIVAALPVGANAIGSVALSATDNAVLDAIVVNTGTNATEAKQDAIIADTAAIQAAVELIDDAIYVDDADWDATSKHMLVGGLYQSSPQTVTDGDVAPVQLDANGCVVLGTGGKFTGYVGTLPPSAVANGKKAVAVTDTAIALDAQAITSGITVKALAANATIVYVGHSTVTTANGFELSAKESVFLEVDNASDVYINGASGVGVTWISS